MTSQGLKMYIQISKIQSYFLREDRSHHKPDPAIIRDFLWSFSSMSFIFLPIPDILFKREYNVPHNDVSYALSKTLAMQRGFLEKKNLGSF